MPFDHFYASLAAVHDDDDGASDVDAPPARPASQRRRCAAQPAPYRGRLHFPVEQLQRVYHLPLKDAAQELGICEAALKRVCRRNHIKKWPYRQLQSVMRRIDEETHLVAMHRVFRETLNDADNAESERFLLPHELEHRRKASVMDARLEQDQREHVLRVEELKRERQTIIDTAHLVESSPCARGCDDDENKCHELPSEMPSPVIMLDAISVDDPLDMLASLCASELSRTTGKEYLKAPNAVYEHGDVRPVEVLSCSMTTVPEEE